MSDGLDTALSALVERSPVRVDLTLPDQRFPAEVEAAAYFACAEGLTNAIKHAGASTVTIDVLLIDAELSVVVSDDGVGGADARRGSGLTGLVDRFDTLGGRLAVEPGVPSGTRLVGTIPLAPPWRVDTALGVA